MKRKTADMLIVLILAISIMMIAYSLTRVNADEIAPTPAISTDKADYAPTETVTVTGENFVPGQSYAIPVTRPDGSIVIGDGSLTTGWDNVTADENGAFTYYYTLDGVLGPYEVRVYLFPWSGDWTDSNYIATITFTDSVQLALDSIAATDSSGTTQSSFSTTGTVYATLTYHSTSGGGSDYSPATVYVYVVTTAPTHTNPAPSITDTRGSPTTVIISGSSPQTVSIWSNPTAGSTYYLVADWKNDGGNAGKYNPEDQVSSIFSVVVQYQVTFKASGLSIDAGTNTVLKVDVGNDGSWDYNYKYSDLSGSGTSVTVGSGTQIKYEYQTPVATSDSGKQYAWDTTTGTGSFTPTPLGRTGTYTITQASTLTGNYKTQWYITVTSAHGSPTAASQWVYDGDPFSVSVTTPDVVVADEHRWVLTGLTVDGTPQILSDSVSYAAVHASHTILFSWTEQYLLTVKTNGLPNGYVTLVYLDGSAPTDDYGIGVIADASANGWRKWFDASPSTTGTIGVDSPVNGAPGTVYLFKDWSDASTDNPHDALALTGPLTLTANYESIILSITKKAPSAVFAGDTIRYIYEVTNTGTASATGIDVTDGSLTVTYVGGDFNGNGKLDPKETWVYTATYGPAGGTHIENTATLTCTEGATAQDTAEVSVYKLEVTKTAETSITRTYSWTISKTATPPTLTFTTGTDTASVGYKITVSATFEDSDWKVTGTITIHNPAPIDAVITDVSDLVSPDIQATIDFGSVTFPYTLGHGQTLNLDYSADLPDDSARTNTATVTMQNYERPFLWDLTGDWVIQVVGVYYHDMFLTMESNGMAFGGTGGWPAGGGYIITETVTGVTAVDDVFWHSVYDTGYFWDAAGTIASDGTMSGSFIDSSAYSGTWASTSGAATLVKTMKGTSTLTGNADVDFSGTTPTEVDKSVTVADTYSGGPQSEIVNYADAPEDFTYTRTIGPYPAFGIYTVKNTASFVTSTTATTGQADCTVTVYRIGSAVTSGTQLFDKDTSLTGRQFTLIFTPDVPDHPSYYRLTASNPGEFFYNVFYVAFGTTGESFKITLPYPFVTQGANPVHIYNSAPNGYAPTGTDITSQFDLTGIPLLLSSYGSGTFGSYATFNIANTGGYTGPLFIRIHLDYGLKKLAGGYTQSSNTALKSTYSTYGDINNNVAYVFSASNSLGPVSDTIYNKNVFKHDPGLAGLVTDSLGNPIQKASVTISGPNGKITVFTDEDGWYQYTFKYTGKAATFTLTLTFTASTIFPAGYTTPAPNYSQTQYATLKSNGFLVVNFQSIVLKTIA